MLLSICLGHKFEIPGFQFSLEELWTQREGLQLNYSPLSPPPKKKQNNAPPAKGKEKKKREKRRGQSFPYSLKTDSGVLPPQPTKDKVQVSLAGRRCYKNGQIQCPPSLCSTSLPSYTGKSCAQHSSKYDESKEFSSEKVVLAHRMSAEAVCNLCVSFYTLDTRGEWNEGNYIWSSKCRGFESPPRSIFL